MIYKIIHILSFIVLLIRCLCDIFYNILILALVYTMSDHCLSFIRKIAIFLLREKSPVEQCQSREGSKSIVMTHIEKSVY